MYIFDPELRLFTVDPNQGTENARPISDCGVKTDVSTRLSNLDDRITKLEEDQIDLEEDQSCTPALATVTQTLATEGYSKSRCGSGENKIGSKEAEFKFAAAGGCVTANVTKVKCQQPVVIADSGGGGGSSCEKDKKGHCRTHLSDDGRSKEEMEERLNPHGGDPRECQRSTNQYRNPDGSWWSGWTCGRK